ncbi:MAG: Hsp20/alpha crystallin family protein [Proteobacteria bacterium]|nr:Hsp20/alpha crystallin family protein [Pseudomonadota bacterium]MBU1709669.1 Hsp20/alpha crystallin family protein [Pseudomonadota bacterium]
MAIIRFMDRPFHNPWADFEKMRREMERLSSGGADDYGFLPRVTVYPAINISEDENTVLVRAEVPGVDPADLDISIEGETLTIKGERKSSTAGQKHSYHRREIETGRFSRAVTLPTKINLEKIEAKTLDGLMTITLPKAEEVKPRKITVRVD